ncbi:hypothetical protein [Paenibacillus sp. 1A_MP2]|uniref:hypothetical protein n=1 Tax=Paenibacillus sp. 1A_MP2 TaxID=3457495 RepID=UPI003FCEDFB8
MTEYQLRPIEEQDIPFLWEMLYASMFKREGEEPFKPEIIHSPGMSKYVEGWGERGISALSPWILRESVWAR